MSKSTKRFTAESDGFGGLIIPDEVVESIRKQQGFTPENPEWKQTPDMIVLEACAGTVIKVMESNYIARLSKDGTSTITIDGEAEVGDRVMHFENQDGSSCSITIGKKEDKTLSQYGDGDSIVVAITPAEGKDTGSLDVIHTVEKNVTYPREATVDGVRYPYVDTTVDGDPACKGIAIVRTLKGWTIDGQLVVAQHAENVAVSHANDGGTAPTELPSNAIVVSATVKNLTEVIEKLKASDNPVDFWIDEELVAVTNLKTLTKRNTFGGFIITEDHNPKLAHGWYTQQPSADDAPVYDALLRNLYKEALRKFSYAPVAEEAAA